MANKPDLKINIRAEVDARIKQALNEISASMEGVSDATKEAAAATQVWKGAVADVSKVKAEYSALRAEARSAGEAVSNAATQAYKQSLLNAKAIRDEAKAIRDRNKVASEGPGPQRPTVDRDARRAAYEASQVSMQFTDIVTSLGSGQSPLTVLLQQGGQLKDMFGGVGGAARVLGGYVASLATSWAGLAAVLGVATFALYRGRQEAEEFNRTLAISNNATGTSIDQLMNMAAALDQVAGTQSRAANVLAQLAGSGVVASDSIQGLAQAAIRLETVGGPAAENTIKNFVELGRSPTEASRKLGEQLGYLTRSTYEQIRALENAGRTAEAAALAQDAYRQSIEASADRIEQRMGTLQKAAKATGEFFKEMWDSILAIGREDTLEEKIAKVEKRLVELRRISSAGFNRAGGADLASAEAELAALREQVRLRDRAADQERKRVEERRKDLRRSDVAFADRGEVFLANAAANADVVKAAMAAANDAYQVAYERGLLNLNQYYDARKAIVERENEAELELLRKQLRQAEINAAKAPLEGRASANASVIALRGRLEAAGISGAGRLSGLEADRAKATRDYAAAIDQLNLRLLANAGAETTAEAAALRRQAAERQFRTQMGQATTDEQRNSIRAAIEAQVAAGELAAQQVNQNREMLQFTTRRAQIEQDIREGKISEIEGQQRLFELERERNQLLLELLQKMQQIPNLTVDQQNAITQAIETSRLALQQMDPLMRQVNLTIRQGLERTFEDALMNVRSLKDGVRSIGQEIARIFARRAAANAASAITSLFGFAEGGHVRGPGTETSDSIPALLSNNEFVMPAKAVRAYGVNFMEAIRRMQVPRMAFAAPALTPGVARYAEGGLVTNGATPQGAAPSFPVQVNITNEGTAKNATASTDFDGKNLVVSVLLDDIRNNGPVFRSISTANKIRR